MKSRIIYGTLVGFVLVLLVNCTKNEIIPIPVDVLTKDGYFTLLESKKEGRYGPVVIFPEIHNSRLIQAEIGFALDMLLETNKLNNIALEGMYKGEIMTGDKLLYDNDEEKYAVLLAQLESGEIKAPEFMYLTKNNLVFGIENKVEYEIDEPTEARGAYYKYLECSVYLDKGDIANSFTKKITDIDTFREFLSLNPWSYETYNIIESYDRSSIEINKRISELESKVKKYIAPPIKADFKKFKIFNQMVYKRSLTMGRNVLKSLKKNNEPTSMIIGAAHTKDITDYFNKKGVSYYVLNPSGLNKIKLWSNLTSAEYKRKKDGKSIFNEKQIADFFMSNRNLRPTLNNITVKTQRDFYLLANRMITMTTSWPPLKYPDNSFFISNGLHIVQNSIVQLTPGDFIYRIENNKGEYMFVRIMDNISDYHYGSVRKALQDMINRLSQIRDTNMSIKQQIKAMNSIIEVCNIGSKICLIGINAEELSMITQ